MELSILNLGVLVFVKNVIHDFVYICLEKRKHLAVVISFPSLIGANKFQGFYVGSKVLALMKIVLSEALNKYSNTLIRELFFLIFFF